ncbi:uncharacterized protein [Eurosta solidaginis]|uniref:uncharacterized protein n=1 Tax=Eurosta solidaginis TaxID=178769 RepID=UPI003530C657
MTNWNSICRVCASPAEYEVFEKIPAYLHANLNEFLNWQKPISVMLEETTGLKCAEEDGMPNKICAICISYLKHAASFRHQYINNCLGLKAAQMLHQQNEKNNAVGDGKRNVDKDSLLVTAEELIFSTDRQTDTNLLNTTNFTQDQNKVCKQLLNNNINSSNTTPPNQQNMEQQMHYLNLLFNKDTNSGLNTYNRSGRNVDDADLYNDDNAIGGGINSDPYLEEDFQTESSSSEENYASTTTRDKSNLFTYTEKNFEEDDIMNIEQLRDAITINIPESCKERKCRACFRRFMFEDSYTEHMSTCIEHKFLEYIEENCRLLALRRAKRISPHEFIRRMIFCIRKTCEWLKKANCGDIILPDLLQNNGSNNENSSLVSKSKGDGDCSSGLENVQTRKSSTASSTTAADVTQIRLSNEKSLHTPQHDLPKNMNNNLTDLLLTTHISTQNYVNAGAEENDPTIQDGNTLTKLLRSNARRSKTTTPITIENNILYEIEHSQSRNSNNLPLSDLELDIDVTTQQQPPCIIGATVGNNKDITARATFLQKLQKAANESPTTAMHLNSMPFASASAVAGTNTPDKPFIRVRKDLLNASLSVDFRQSPSNGDMLKPIPITPPHVGSGGFSARCNPCNLLFETLAALEIHNAMNHNNQATNNQLPIIPPAAKSLDEVEREAEHQRIIALFEDDED